MQDDIVKSFLMLFVVTDSLGNIPIFNSLLERFDPKVQKRDQW